MIYRAQADNPSLAQQIRSCVPVGWSQIISEHFDDLMHADHVHMKEKFGFLDIDIDEARDQTFEGMVAIANDIESRTQATCMLTGRPGTVRRDLGAWWRTFSDDAAEFISGVEYGKVRGILFPEQEG